MSSRSRTREHGNVTGSWTYGQTVREYSEPWYTEVCVDVPDNFGGENEFTLTKTDNVVGLVSGRAGGGLFQTLPLTLYECRSHVDTAPEPSSFYNEVRARTNPSRPDLPFPVSLFELREFRKNLMSDITNVNALFRRSHVGLDKVLSNLYLSYEMGWRPLMSDIRKLLDIKAVADRRLQELQSLADNKGIRTQAHLQSTTTEGSWSATKTQHSSLSLWITVKYRDTTDRQVWGSARWEPSDSFPSNFLYLSQREKEWEAFRTVMGIRPDQITYNVWSALPWSWLCDWFDSMSDALVASNNSIAHVLHGKCCIMQHATTKREFEVVSKPSTITITNHSSTYESKSRRVISGQSEEASVPFFSRRRLSVITALVSQRS